MGRYEAPRLERPKDVDQRFASQLRSESSVPGKVVRVRVEWNHLDGDSGQARKFRDGEYLILVDRRDNTSFAGVRRTLHHESCHVFVDWKEPEEHGPMFQTCFKRFADAQ